MTRRAIRLGWVGAPLLVGAMTATASAQVVRDGTIGPDVSVQPSGPDYEITEDMGDVAGSSLFHGFSDFSFDSSETISFFSGIDIANIFSRVTGGRASMLDGMLAATATMYLINPAGLIFGPNATLSVNGSFYASTADYIEFIDGLRFEAEPMGGQVLSAMDPNSFGFLSDNPGSNITVDGATLSMADGNQFGECQ
jgi:filamentous hemagglutinin family protein